MALMPAGLGRSPSARQEGKPPLSVPAHPHWRKGRTRLGRWRSLGIAWGIPLLPIAPLMPHLE